MRTAVAAFSRPHLARLYESIIIRVNNNPTPCLTPSLKEVRFSPGPTVAAPTTPATSSWAGGLGGTHVRALSAACLRDLRVGGDAPPVPRRPPVPRSKAEMGGTPSRQLVPSIDAAACSNFDLVSFNFNLINYHKSVLMSTTLFIV